jgi:hypothetical protein
MWSSSIEARRLGDQISPGKVGWNGADELPMITGNSQSPLGGPRNYDRSYSC